MVSHSRALGYEHHSNSSSVTVASSASLALLPSVARTTIFGSVSHSLPRLTTQGYSADVLHQLSLSRVASSNKTYESKWKLFASFCASRDLDPFSASPAVVADFLLWVARTRRASPSTLAGYRSALGHVLRLTTGYCPGECRVLRQLMQSFKRTQPLPSTRIPSWDVNLVLSVFCEPQYSDDNLSLHLLTAKTVFLLALASGERRSALAACAYPPTFDQDGMIVNFCRAFVPKCYFVRKNFTAVSPLKIPFVSDDASFQVCPCRTMLFYPLL